MKSIFKITGMTCNGCKSSIEDKLSSLDGVDGVQVYLNKGEGVIQSKKPCNNINNYSSWYYNYRCNSSTFE